MQLLFYARIFLNFIRDSIQRAQKNKFSITEYADPADLWKIYFALCNQFSEFFVKKATRKDCCLFTQFLKKKPRLRRNLYSQARSCMKGNVRVIEGTLIAMSNDNMTSLFPSRKVARKPPWKRKKHGRN
jgi:hypothetical protein